MGGFKARKQMTKREMQDQIVDQSENAVKMVQGLAVVINQQIRNLKLETSNLASMSIMSEDGGAVNKKSILYIDFVGSIESKPFEGGLGVGVFVDMEVHQFIADFQANLLGMTAGQEKTFDVKFPENYQSKELAGKTAQFEVCVRKVLNEVTSRIAEKALELQKKFEIEKAEAAAKVNQQAVTQEGV